jgi:coenzyme F420-reducing hydrogenase alpha subunit
MSRGGKREGSGRPKGSTTRPQFRDYITPDEIKGLVEEAKKQAKDKPEILKFVLEQIFGKAMQPTDITSGGQPIQPSEETREIVTKAIEEYLEKTKDNPANS